MPVPIRILQNATDPNQLEPRPSVFLLSAISYSLSLSLLSWEIPPAFVSHFLHKLLCQKKETEESLLNTTFADSFTVFKIGSAKEISA
jgi:hypothetical protein